MITYSVRIVAGICSIPLFMSGHWIWGLILFIIAVSFYARDGYGNIL